ncbi:hypothetical protein [uncultured Tolumonas sp.]|uniref:hypothetical protein n=1 Tax=uncultured Tolumonas sp. TaxID=263765 RepID=UPI002A0A4A8B|nr:hypothetical protein [uncultured Tolumonas sp.]
MSFFNEFFFGFILINASDRLIIIDGIIMETTGEYKSIINHDGIPMTVNIPIGMKVKNENATNNDVSEITLYNI